MQHCKVPSKMEIDMFVLYLNNDLIFKTQIDFRVIKISILHQIKLQKSKDSQSSHKDQYQYFHMKRSYQLMQIYDIERDYGRHKQKLKSIKHIDTHKKVSQSSRNIQTHSTYKKSHSIANSFLSKQTNKKIQKQNDFLYKTLIKENSRKPHMTLRQNSHTDSSKSLMRNTSLTIKISRIKQENSKIKKKIQTTRSTYEQFRKSSTSISLSKKKDKDKGQQQLKRFLENQFRIKPTVLFPHVNKAKSIERSKLSDTVVNKLLPKFYERQLNRTLNSKRSSRISKEQSSLKKS